MPTNEQEIDNMLKIWGDAMKQVEGFPLIMLWRQVKSGQIGAFAPDSITLEELDDCFRALMAVKLEKLRKINGN